jgi:large subunit ribosomal protein L23
MDPHYIIKRVVRTEKSVMDTTQNNKYHFEVPRSVTKYQIRNAVESLYPDVEVVSVNTVTERGKRRRHRYVVGSRRDTKKAVVTLRPGDAINVGY